jgi:hypothetical protein
MEYRLKEIQTHKISAEKIKFNLRPVANLGKMPVEAVALKHWSDRIQRLVLPEDVQPSL